MAERAVGDLIASADLPGEGPGEGPGKGPGRYAVPDGDLGVPNLADLAGTWSVTRRIIDRDGRQNGHFSGEAVWRRCDQKMLDAFPRDGIASADVALFEQVERGVLRLNGTPEMQAERRYLWAAWGGADAAASRAKAAGLTGQKHPTESPDARGLAVFFADGRPFHRVRQAPSERGQGPGVIADSHACAPDMYRVAYAFFSATRAREVREAWESGQAFGPFDGGAPQGAEGDGHNAQLGAGPARAGTLSLALPSQSGETQVMAFTTHWRVTGPRKNLEIYSFFERCADAESPME